MSIKGVDGEGGREGGMCVDVYLRVCEKPAGLVRRGTSRRNVAPERRAPGHSQRDNVEEGDEPVVKRSISR